MTENEEPDIPSEESKKKSRLTVHVLFSVLLFVTGAFTMPLSGALFWFFTGDLFQVFPVLTALFGILLVCAILEIVGSIGLLKLLHWARTMTIWVVFISFLCYVAVIINVAAFGATYGVGVEDVPYFAGPAFILLFGPILIHLVIITYFYTEEGKRAFSEATE